MFFCYRFCPDLVQSSSYPILVSFHLMRKKKLQRLLYVLLALHPCLEINDVLMVVHVYGPEVDSNVIFRHNAVAGEEIQGFEFLLVLGFLGARLCACGGGAVKPGLAQDELVTAGCS